MQLWFLISITLSVHGNVNDIYCSNYRQCQNKTINCINNSTCNIYCSEESCSYSTINCPNGYYCNIYLSEYQSAFQSIINGNHAKQLLIVTSDANTGDEQLSQSFINCPLNGICRIECNNNYHNCRLTNIQSKYSNSLHLKCVNINEVCHDISIWCPIKGHCEIEAYTDTNAMRQMNIYSILGFDTFNVSGFASQSIGIMHCLGDYSSYCQISASNNNECESRQTDLTCDHPPPPTTTATTTYTTQINVTNVTMINTTYTTTEFNNTNTTIFNTTVTTSIPKHKIGFGIVDIQYMLLSFIMVIILLILIVINIKKFSNYKSKHMLWKIKCIAMIQMISLWLSYLFWIIAVIVRSNCYDLHCVGSKYYILYMCMD
eukprot:95073_1